MSVSERYRSLIEDIKAFVATQKKQVNSSSPPAVQQGLRAVTKGFRAVDELSEGVGEIPRIRLEDELTPVLMKAHNNLDRGRLNYLEAGDEKSAAAVWELQQTIYRLLNNL
jgi:hypothetical protein